MKPREFEESEIFSLHLPFVGPSANKFYAGMFHNERRKLARQWDEDVGWLVKQQAIQPILDDQYPLKVICRGFFKRRCYDADNLLMTVKLILDGLKKMNIITDDSPKYISNIEIIPKHIKRS